jgi:ABC-2 type transport system permease protein
MRIDRAWEIARKDMASVRKRRSVFLGLVGIPLIFAVIFPLTTIYPVLNMPLPPENQLPAFAPGGLQPRQALVAGMVNWAVLMFMFIPIAIPSTIASYTIVGEKVNKQLEPLLATPLSDFELLIGKSLGAFIPTMAATIVSFVGFAAVVDLLTIGTFGYLVLPNVVSILVLFIYGPLLCLLSISWCVFVSSKVSDVRAAVQLGTVAAVPIFAFYGLFIAGIVKLDFLTMLLFGLLLLAASAGLFLLGKATFKREEILTKWR